MSGVRPPVAPAFLDEEGVQTWRRTFRLLHDLGLWRGDVDRPGLSRYCHADMLAREALANRVDAESTERAAQYLRDAAQYWRDLELRGARLPRTPSPPSLVAVA